MSLRRDALAGAAEAILAVERFAGGGVATVGRIEIRPGAHNVVPAEADLWAEARSPDAGWLDNFGRNLAEELDAIGTRRHLGTKLSWISREHPVTATDWVADAIGEAARSRGRADEHPERGWSRRVPHGATRPDGHGVRAIQGGAEPLPGRMDRPRGHRPRNRCPCRGDRALRPARGGAPGAAAHLAR